MSGILLVSGNTKGGVALAQLLKGYAYTTIDTVSSAAQARRKLTAGAYDLVLVNTPLSDEQGQDFAVAAAQASDAGVLLLVKNDIMGPVIAKAEGEGVFVLSKPIHRSDFFRTLHIAEGCRKRMRASQAEAEKLKKKLEEARLVGTAKCLLVENQKMTEQEAHRYIEKQAMDERVTRMEIAKQVIFRYQAEEPYV